MRLSLRRHFAIVEERNEDFGQARKPPLKRVAVASVIENPFAGRYVEDLTPLIEASVPLGEVMAQMAMDAMRPYAVQSYGKGGIVGTAGEQEHANALLTTAFAQPFREAMGGGEAWISSMTKVAAPGTPIDIPMNHKENVYVRSHYDGMTVQFPDAPLPEEIVILFCLASRGRLNARVGGLTHDEAVAEVREREQS